MIFWIPIAIAAASALSSILSSSSKAAQAKEQAAIVEDMIDIEEENYELIQDARTWEGAEQRFNNQREKWDIQAGKRTQLLTSQLNSLAGTFEEKQVRGNLLLAKQQEAINQEVDKQGLSAEKIAVEQGKQQIGAQAGQAIGGLQRVQNAATDTVNGLQTMEGMQLAREAILADSSMQQGEISAQLKQNQDHTKAALDIQRRQVLTDNETQRQASLGRQRVGNQVGQFDRSLIRVQSVGTQLARRADRLQQRALTDNQKLADQLTHESKVAQLRLGQPSVPSMLPSIIGGVASVASAAYGSMGSSAAAQQVTPSLSAISGGVGGAAIGSAGGMTMGSSAGGPSGLLGYGAGTASGYNNLSMNLSSLRYNG